MSLGLGALRRKSLESVYRRAARLLCEEPVVSFTFDDFPRSALEVGGALLERYDAHGTYYASPALQGTSNHLGEMFSEDDLHAVLQRGHELANHTFGHVSGKTLRAAEYWENVEQGFQQLRRVAGGNSANFAYPFGDLTVSVKRALRGVCSARGIFPGVNERDFDRGLLRANSLYGSAGTIPTARDLIQKAVRKRGWLIFYTHDVQASPSRYGCTAEHLESILREVRQSGMRILTVQEVLKQCIWLQTEES